MERKKASDFPAEVLKLFDGYIHGMLGRRDFLDRAAQFAAGGFTAVAMLESLTPNYAFAQQVAKDDLRFRGCLVEAGSVAVHLLGVRPAREAVELPQVDAGERAESDDEHRDRPRRPEREAR